MIMFWVAVLAVSILLYALLDGFDLGLGMLLGVTREGEARRSMMSAVAPIWDGNETWLVVAGVVLWGAFPLVYSILLSAFYLPMLRMLAGLILRGVAFEYRSKTERTRWIRIPPTGGHLQRNRRCPLNGRKPPSAVRSRDYRGTDRVVPDPDPSIDILRIANAIGNAAAQSSAMTQNARGPRAP